MLTVSILLIAQARFTPPFARDVLEVDSGAVYLMPPQWIAGPNVREWSWSDDGKTLAVGGAQVTGPLEEMLPRQSADADSFVSVWNPATGKAIELARSKGSHGLLQWMGGKSLTFLSIEAIPSGPNRPEPGQRCTIRIWSPGDRQSGALWSDELPNGELPDFTVSPTIPYGIIRAQSQGAFQTWIVGPKRSPLRIEASGGFIVPERSGKLVLSEARRNPNGGDRPIRVWSRLEPDGRIIPLPDRPELYERDRQDVDPKAPRPGTAPGQASFGKIDLKLNNGWLTSLVGSQPKAALVAADAENVKLSPDGSYVAYESQTNLFVRKLKVLTPAEYQAMLDAAEKLQLMSQTKQLGVAMMIYAADNDDRLPGKDGFLSVLSPYVKDTSIFQGFAYQMNGEDLTKVQDPANQVVGYTQGKSGRAVLYSDGHVRWIPNG